MRGDTRITGTLADLHLWSTHGALAQLSFLSPGLEQILHATWFDWRPLSDRLPSALAPRSPFDDLRRTTVKDEAVSVGWVFFDRTRVKPLAL